MLNHSSVCNAGFLLGHSHTDLHDGLNLNMTSYPEWHPEFKYHGHNAYAALLAKWGITPRGLRTFDLVDIQL